MMIDQAIKAIRGWQAAPESVRILLAEYEKIARELKRLKAAEK